MRNIGIVVLAAACVLIIGCGGAADGHKAQDADAYRYAKSHEMQQVLVAGVLYMDAHEGNWPDSLDQVTKYLKGQAIDLRVYEYQKPPMKLSPQETSRTVVLLEKLTEFGGGELAGFADGHVIFSKTPPFSGFSVP